MGTLTSLEKLYDNIAKSNQALEPAAVRAEAERYTANVTTGIATMETFYNLFDNAFDGSPGVHRFSRSERARRKAVSAKVRRAMNLYVSNSAVERDTLPEAPQWLRNFLHPTGHDENADIFRDQNQKRLLELQPDTEDGRIYMQSVYVPLVMSQNPELSREQAEAQAKQEIQKMQSEFTESFVWQAKRVMDDLDQMVDPNLPAEDLAKNIENIVHAKRICDCMETYLEQANNGTLALSEENKKLMEQELKFRPRLTMAINKLEAMANPMYEYFDVERLGAYDLSAIRTVWKEEILPGRTLEWRGEKSRKHAHFNQYVTTDIQDNFTNFLENAANFNEARQELSRQQLQDAVEEYGFDPKETRSFRETPSTEDSPDKKKQMQKTGAVHTLNGRQNLHLYQDAPIAYYQKGKTVIFTPADTLTGLTTSRPEELYNYSFNGTAANLEKALTDADRWYKTNKHGYGSMRKQLAKIKKMGKLPRNFNQNDIQRRKEVYQALVESSNIYINSKGINAQGRDDVERARLAAARRARTFAEMRLRELDMIANAKMTASLRDHVANRNDNPINAAAANENDNPINAAPAKENNGKDFVGENHSGQREDNLVRPLHQHYSKEFAQENQLPENLAKMMEENLNELEWRWDNDALLEKNLESQYSTSCDAFERSLGTITAAEMILEERKRMGGTGGPVESFFATADQRLYVNLGYRVAVSFRGNTEGELERIKTVLREFKPEDPRFNTKEYANDREELHAPIFQQDIAVRYRSDVNLTGDQQRDDALRQFVQTYILDGLDERIKQGFLEEKPANENRDYLAACVVRDLVLMERGDDPAKGPGALEQKMMNSPKELIEDIRGFPFFKSCLDRLVKKRQGMYWVFSGNYTKDIAVSFIKKYNEKIRENRNDPDKENDKPDKAVNPDKNVNPKNEEQERENRRREMLKQVWG